MARPISSESAFRALAHNTRREIIMALVAGERAASDILPATSASKPTMSDHLRILQHTGFIAFRRKGGKLIYRLNINALRPLDEFLKRLRSRAQA